MEPRSGVRFDIHILPGEKPAVTGGTVNAMNRAPRKTRSASAIDAVRVLVADVSTYEKGDSLRVRPEWFTSTADSFNDWTVEMVLDTMSLWSQWEKLIGDRFRIVADQALAVKDSVAEGSVAGVVGLNFILVGLLEKEHILYGGHMFAHGEEGEANELQIYVWPHYDHYQYP